MKTLGPIGVFDSGYGGLTILKGIQAFLPQYDYLYLGDNARAPYGTRSFDRVHEFTLQAVKYLFGQGCPLIIIACNTASAKALRSIQQQYLPAHYPDRRVLGVIRPTVETLPSITRSGHIGLMATAGTVASHSYCLEVEKIDPSMTVKEQACPLLVPLIENGEAESPGAEYFVKKYINELLAQDHLIDTVILGCTHYPILEEMISRNMPQGVKTLSQASLVGESLKDYLHRHPEIECQCTQTGTARYLTTENPSKFDTFASLFLGKEVQAQHIGLN